MLFDFIGAITSLWSTYYFIRIDIKAWPMGMIATGINCWLYWDQGIYADMWLETFYFISICYGWVRWKKQPAKNTSSIKYLTKQQHIYLIIGIFALYTLIYNLLITFSNSTVAKLDALTTSLSIAAQCLTCYKVITSWVLWFTADVLYALMYQNKSLPFHTIIMFIYIAFAITGYFCWKKETTPRLLFQKFVLSRA